MAPAPHNSRMMKQAERLLAPWDGISEVSSRMEGGAMFELPMKSTGIRQMKF